MKLPLGVKRILHRYTKKEHELSLLPEDIDRIVRAAGAHPWHAYTMRERATRKDICEACGWIAQHLPKNAQIFELGCGCGQNLLWLAEQGFSKLYGIDISKENIAAGRQLAELAKVFIQLKEDNALHPRISLKHIDLILSINWLYYIEGATLENFLEIYTQFLYQNGICILDIVDSSYNTINNNNYHTQDWQKPEYERRQSEYKSRYSHDDIVELVEQFNFKIFDILDGTEVPPRKIYVLQKHKETLI